MVEMGLAVCRPVHVSAVILLPAVLFYRALAFMVRETFCAKLYVDDFNAFYFMARLSFSD